MRSASDNPPSSSAIAFAAYNFCVVHENGLSQLPQKRITSVIKEDGPDHSEADQVSDVDATNTRQ
jgi:hypothetical protein